VEMLVARLDTALSLLKTELTTCVRMLRSWDSGRIHGPPRLEAPGQRLNLDIEQSIEYNYYV